MVCPRLFEVPPRVVRGIAGTDLTNPIAMIGSLAMAMRYTFERGDLADRIEAAVAAVLAKGLRTADIKGNAASHISAAEMGDAIVAALRG